MTTVTIDNRDKQLVISEITQLLRERALSESPRAVDPNKPVGVLGLGLDSLALLQFITMIENRFTIELPDSLWTEQSKITINNLADFVLSKQTGQLGDSPSSSEAQTSRVEPQSIRQILNEQGFVRGFLPAVQRLPKRLLQSVISNTTFYIIAFDLTAQQLPEYQAAIPLEIRPATLSDIDLVTAIWAPEEQVEKRQLYKERLINGFTGFIAFTNGRAVGIDWLSRSGDKEKAMGLTITVKPGVCYGLDLNEHPDFSGKGVGMALLAHALRESHKEGFRRQYAIVHSENEKMLGAAIHLLGFKKAGELSTLTLFGTPRSTWDLNAQTGRGRSLEL